MYGFSLRGFGLGEMGRHWFSGVRASGSVGVAAEPAGLVAAPPVGEEGSRVGHHHLPEVSLGETRPAEHRQNGPEEVRVGPAGHAEEGPLDGVRLADVNGDGLQDIVTGWEEGGRIRVYLNPGHEKSKAKWPAVTVGKVGSPEDAVFVDLDDDGATDVVSCCEGNVKTVWVHWAPENLEHYMDSSKWRTEAIPSLEGAASWMFCLPLQVDNRHGNDLVLAAKGTGAQIGWLQCPEQPRRLSDWKWHPLYEAGWIMSLVAYDMDEDGDPDIVASDRKGENRGCLWLENPGANMVRSTPWKERRIGPGNKEVMFLDLVDLDRDSLMDVLVAVRGDKLIYMHHTGDHPPGWQDFAIELPGGTGTGKAVRAGDVDLDGRIDIVFSCEPLPHVDCLFQVEDSLGCDHQLLSAGFETRCGRVKVGERFEGVEPVDLTPSARPEASADVEELLRVLGQSPNIYGHSLLLGEDSLLSVPRNTQPVKVSLNPVQGSTEGEVQW